MRRQRISNTPKGSEGAQTAAIDLQRFIIAQNARQKRSGTSPDVHTVAYEEMSNGAKKGHWYVSYSLFAAIVLFSVSCHT